MSVLTSSWQSGVQEMWREMENCHFEVQGEPGTHSMTPVTHTHTHTHIAESDRQGWRNIDIDILDGQIDKPTGT